MTVSLAWSTDVDESTSLMVECTPFHSDTAVGRDARMVRTASSRSDLNPSMEFPVYPSANAPIAPAPARAILPAPRMVMLRILSAVSATMSCTSLESLSSDNKEIVRNLHRLRRDVWLTGFVAEDGLPYHALRLPHAVCEIDRGHEGLE